VTRDYFDDFIEACQKEGVGYLVFMVSSDGETVRGTWDLSMMEIDTDKSYKDDLTQMFEAMGLFDETEGDQT